MTNAVAADLPPQIASSAEIIIVLTVDETQTQVSQEFPHQAPDPEFNGLWFGCGSWTTNIGALMYRHARGDMQASSEMQCMLFRMIGSSAPLEAFAHMFLHGILVFSLDVGCAFHVHPCGTTAVAHPEYCLQALSVWPDIPCVAAASMCFAFTSLYSCGHWQGKEQPTPSKSSSVQSRSISTF